LVVEKVVDSQYQNDTNKIFANANLFIANPMQLVVDGHHRIELLDINCQKSPADANNAYQCWPTVNQFNQ
jgi:hypothetical protein